MLFRSVGIEIGGAVNLPGRAMPVGGEGEGEPAGLRPQLLLADVMGPAAAALADAAAQEKHVDDAAVGHVHVVRSEEHTSELQSLMRISYAVFCLKKKNIKTTKTHIKQ